MRLRGAGQGRRLQVARLGVVVSGAGGGIEGSISDGDLFAKTGVWRLVCRFRQREIQRPRCPWHNAWAALARSKDTNQHKPRPPRARQTPGRAAPEAELRVCCEAPVWRHHEYRRRLERVVWREHEAAVVDAAGVVGAGRALEDEVPLEEVGRGVGRQVGDGLLGVWGGWGVVAMGWGVVMGWCLWVWAAWCCCQEGRWEGWRGQEGAVWPPRGRARPRAPPLAAHRRWAAKALPTALPRSRNARWLCHHKAPAALGNASEPRIAARAARRSGARRTRCSALYSFCSRVMHPLVAILAIDALLYTPWAEVAQSRCCLDANAHHTRSGA